MYKITFYWNERGDAPVREFLNQLPDKIRAKVQKWIALLKATGPDLRRPYADKVKGKLYELRVRLGSDQTRILYFFMMGNRIVLLHGFRKKSSAIEIADIEIAERRMNDFFTRAANGRVSLEEDNNE